METSGNTPQYKPITNFEVYQHLIHAKARREQSTQGKRHRKHQGKRVVSNAEFIEHVTHFSLQKSPAAEVDERKIKDFLKRVVPFRLTRAEIVEECQERLTDEEVDGLLQLIIQIFEIKMDEPAEAMPDATENDGAGQEAQIFVDPEGMGEGYNDQEYVEEDEQEYAEGEAQEAEEEGEEEEEEEDEFEFVAENQGRDEEDDD